MLGVHIMFENYTFWCIWVGIRQPYLGDVYTLLKLMGYEGLSISSFSVVWIAAVIILKVMYIINLQCLIYWGYAVWLLPHCHK